MWLKIHLQCSVQTVCYLLFVTNILGCLTEEYKTAREKCVHAQLTSDLDTRDTEIERHKSRARRHKINHFQEIDAIEGQRDSLETTMSTPRAVPRPATLRQPPPPPATLTPSCCSSGRRFLTYCALCCVD